MILTVLDCHTAWNIRISKIQFPKVLHLGSPIKYNLYCADRFYVIGPFMPYVPGIDLQYLLR